MADLNKTYIFRLTHIENIAHIIRYGITHSDSENANEDYISIGDPSLILKRNDFVLTNGNLLRNYMPFYFSTRTPMLYVIQKGFNLVSSLSSEKIIYCISSIQKIIDEDLDFIFTDGHAINRFSAQYSKEDIKNINSIIDWKAISAKYWNDSDDLDLKRRKEAEFLVSGDIPFKSILGFAVYNEIAKEKLINFGIEESSIVIKKNLYF